jgi:hypothetical protein
MLLHLGGGQHKRRLFGSIAIGSLLAVDMLAIAVRVNYGPRPAPSVRKTAKRGREPLKRSFPFAVDDYDSSGARSFRPGS